MPQALQANCPWAPWVSLMGSIYENCYHYLCIVPKTVWLGAWVMSQDEKVVTLRLPDVRPGRAYRVVEVQASVHAPEIVRQLEEIGFFPGERVVLTARGAIGGDPLAFRVGQSKFALRRSEATCVLVQPWAEGRS